jgi:hypothetical protein
MSSSKRHSTPIIRASEIGRWVYCQRAWWLSKEGYENRNVAALQTGLDVHQQHARQVAGAYRTWQLALIFLALGVLLLLAAFLFGFPLG